MTGRYLKHIDNGSVHRFNPVLAKHKKVREMSVQEAEEYEAENNIESAVPVSTLPSRDVLLELQEKEKVDFYRDISTCDKGMLSAYAATLPGFYYAKTTGVSQLRKQIQEHQALIQEQLPRRDGVDRDPETGEIKYNKEPTGASKSLGGEFIESQVTELEADFDLGVDISKMNKAELISLIARVPGISVDRKTSVKDLKVVVQQRLDELKLASTSANQSQSETDGADQGGDNAGDA
jgi:hypothetical protein